MDAIEALHGRRSIRAYQPQPVARDLIEAIIWDAAQAPSTPVSGAHPWMFNVIDDAARIAEYGPRALRFVRDHRPEGPGYAWVDRAEFSVFFNAPAVVVISGRGDNAQAPFECCRAGQNLMIAAHARGLGTCWVGSPMLWLADPEVKAELRIPPDHTAMAVFTLGYPAATPAPALREKPRIIWIGDISGSS